MSQILIIYYSSTGNTKKMAQYVKKGVEEENIPCVLLNINSVTPGDLLEYEGIIVGSPTYYGNMAWEIKKLFDESVRYHGRLAGKVGGAFASSANIGGGNETTIMSILQMMLIHGMIVQGSASGDHYGPVGINSPDSRVESQCIELGKRVAKLVKKLFGE